MFLALPVYSQPQVYLLATGSPNDRRLSSVIERSALLEIQHAGLKGIIGEQNIPATDPLPAAVPAARQSGSSFLLVARYRKEDGQVVMELSFVQTARGNLLAAESASLSLDLDLDVRIDSVVRRLLDAQPVRAALASAERTAGSGSGGSESAAHEARRTDGGAGRAQAAPIGAPGAAEPVRLPPRAGASRWGLAVSGQVAPLILVGGGSGFFRYGADLSLFAGARLPSRGVDLEAGVKVAASELFPVAGLLPGQAYLFLAGPEVRVGSAAALPVAVSARASAGAAIIMVDMAGSSPLAKTVPYVDAGLSASLRLLSRLRLGAELGFLVVFEGEYPIMGIAPALTVEAGW